MIRERKKMPVFEKRPWGNYRALLRGEGFQVKRIEVNPGARFSLQKHMKRDENWIVLGGRGRVTLGRRVIRVKPGFVLRVPRKAIHRMENVGKKPLVFIEVQMGEYLGEDDIVRFADDYGRTRRA